VLTEGRFAIHDAGSEEVIAYTRHLGDETILVLLNFSEESVTAGLPATGDGVPPEVLAGNYGEAELSSGRCRLRPFEAVVAAMPDARTRQRRGDEREETIGG
jgi:oligo-1,6-glucosidase